MPDDQDALGLIQTYEGEGQQELCTDGAMVRQYHRELDSGCEYLKPA